MSALHIQTSLKKTCQGASIPAAYLPQPKLTKIKVVLRLTPGGQFFLARTGFLEFDSDFRRFGDHREPDDETETGDETTRNDERQPPIVLDEDSGQKTAEDVSY